MEPFTDKASESVSSVKEVKLIKLIREWLGECVPEAPAGMGDDCAVVDSTNNLITCDSVLYSKHFDKECLPEQAGEKLLKRNVSDIAAMGALPKDAVIAMFLPPATKLEWVKGFCHGLSRAAERYSTRIVGGDISASDSPFLAASMTLTGKARKPLLRTGAKAGDLIYVSGPLGCSIMGHHLTFEPRVEQGMFLSFFPGTSACMDISDGLGKDLPELCGETLCAALDLDDIPPSAETLADVGEKGTREEILRHIFQDGEDYELLFTISSEEEERFEESWKDRFGAAPFKIGRMVEKKDKGSASLLDAASGEPLNFKGYEHL